MAYTLLKNIDQDARGGGYPFYFHKADVDRIYEKYPQCVATKLIKARYPKGDNGEEIFVLVGVVDISDPKKAPVFEQDDAIVALPCPPLEIAGGQYLDENGNQAKEPK